MSETSTCGICGFSWPTGTNGDHSCAGILAAEVAGLRALVADQSEVLKAVEWSGFGFRFDGDPKPFQCCPVCRSTMVEEGQHTDDCLLERALWHEIAASALAWLEEEKRRAVRASLEEIETQAKGLYYEHAWHEGLGRLAQAKLAELRSTTT